MTTDNLTTDRPTRSTDWAEAVHNCEEAKCAFDRAEAELDAASAAWREAVPDRADEFLTYGLNRYHIRDNADRAALIRATEMSVAMKYYKGRESLTADDFAAITHKAVTIVDDFLAWLALDREASDRIYGGGVQERFDAACDALSDARDKLLRTPAPDANAMLFKLELLAKIMREADVDDAERIEAVRDDAKRLFGGS